MTHDTPYTLSMNDPFTQAHERRKKKRRKEGKERKVLLLHFSHPIK